MGQCLLRFSPMAAQDGLQVESKALRDGRAVGMSCDGANGDYEGYGLLWFF